MTNIYDLVIPLRSFWMHGFGEGGGEDYDLLAVRDEDGFPKIRGRHVKGLLRVALKRAVLWKWCEAKTGRDLIVDLLGAADTDISALKIPSARIPEDVKKVIADEGKAHVAALFQAFASTAMNEHGVAKHASLRRLEAVVPITLISRITFMPESEEIDEAYANGQWAALLAISLPALDEIGSHRTRGFGRIGGPPTFVEQGE